MRIINLLVRARFETQIVGAPGRVHAHSTTKFPKLWMAGNNVGMARAPGAIVHLGNPNDALVNEETGSRAPKAPTPLTGESLDIIGSLDHLHLDPLRSGNVWSCMPQPIFHRTMEASGPVQGPLFDLPLTRSRGGLDSPSTGTTRVSSREYLISSIEDPSLLSWSLGDPRRLHDVRHGVSPISTRPIMPRIATNTEPCLGQSWSSRRGAGVASMANREATTRRFAETH